MAGGGGVELEVAKQLSEFGKKETGLDQYAIAKFAEALEVCLSLSLISLSSIFSPHIRKIV